MQKRPLQDIVSKRGTPSRRHTASNVQSGQNDVPVRTVRPRSKAGTRIPSRRRLEQEAPASSPITDDVPPRRARSERRRGNGWLIIALGIGAAILIIAFFVSIIFSGATVTVFPKQQSDVFVDGTFIAKKEPLVGELGYNLMTVERTSSQTVDATREEEAEEFASGEIIVYNEFDENPQRLIKNTRFETPDGKIYRTRESVTVPGMTVSDLGVKEPGSITLEVFADEPGESYNVGLTEFKIPGFEGTARYDKFNAKSKTPIEGGFKGTRLALDADVEDSTRDTIREKLVDDLKKAAFSSSEKPEGYYLYEEAVFIEFEKQESVELEGNKVEIREKGILHAVLFEEGEFARHIAANTIAGYDENPVMLQNPDDLSLSIERVDEEDIPWDGTTYRMKVTGTADFEWKFDEEMLKKDIAGKEYEAFTSILAEYPSIDKAEAALRPIWRGSFPESTEDISVVKVLD